MRTLSYAVFSVQIWNPITRLFSSPVISLRQDLNTPSPFLNSTSHDRHLHSRTKVPVSEEDTFQHRRQPLYNTSTLYIRTGWQHLEIETSALGNITLPYQELSCSENTASDWILAELRVLWVRDQEEWTGIILWQWRNYMTHCRMVTVTL